MKNYSGHSHGKQAISEADNYLLKWGCKGEIKRRKKWGYSEIFWLCPPKFFDFGKVPPSEKGLFQRVDNVKLNLDPSSVYQNPVFPKRSLVPGESYCCLVALVAGTSPGSVAIWCITSQSHCPHFLSLQLPHQKRLVAEKHIIKCWRSWFELLSTPQKLDKKNEMNNKKN